MRKNRDIKRFWIILFSSVSLYGTVFFGIAFYAVGKQDLVELMVDVAILLMCKNFYSLSERSGDGTASLFLVVLSFLWGFDICVLTSFPTWFAMKIYSSAVAPEEMYKMGFIELYAGLMKLGPLRLCAVAGLIVFSLLGSFVFHYLFVNFKDNDIIQ